MKIHFLVEKQFFSRKNNFFSNKTLDQQFNVVVVM